MARTYKRDSRGRFAGGGGSSSRGGGRKPMQRGTNRLTRDNTGRITSVGGDGATARGGRLRTASGKQRATVTAKGIGKAPAGTVSRSGRVKAPARVAAKPALKRTGRKVSIPSLKTNTERGRKGIVSMSTGAKQARRGAVAERKAERRARVLERQSGIVARRQGNRLSTYSPSGAFNQAAQNLNQSKLKKSKQIQSWLTTRNPADKPQSRRQKQAAAKPASAAKPAKSPRTPRIKVKTVKMWHGTTPAAASKIRKGGFRESKDGVYGDGVYAGTKAVARQYGRAAVAIRIPAFKIKDASGSSRQIRALANQLTPSGKVVRWQHSVADRPKQSAFTLSTADANKYRQRIRGSGRRLRISG